MSTHVLVFGSVDEILQLLISDLSGVDLVEDYNGHGANLIAQQSIGEEVLQFRSRHSQGLYHSWGLVSQKSCGSVH